MIEKNIFAYQHFSSLNISDFSLKGSNHALSPLSSRKGEGAYYAGRYSKFHLDRKT